MGLMWFMLGSLTVGSLWGLIIWNSKKKLTKIQLSGFVISLIMAVFALAWSLSSVAESEAQAAAMGMMIFGGTAVILFLLSLKLPNIMEMFFKNKVSGISNNKEAH